MDECWGTGDATIDFSNILTKSQLEEMATSDEFEVVKEVQVRAILHHA